MERAIGGLPRFASIETMLGTMDEAGVEKVLIAQCKMWSYWRKWMYMDTQLEDVLQYTEKYPDRFAGLAGYNPFRIRESLTEIGATSLICAPILFGDRVLGLIHLYCTDPHQALDGEDLEFAVAVAKSMSSVIHQMQRHTSLSAAKLIGRAGS